MNSSLVAPELDGDQYSTIKTDVNTGHVLQPNGELYIGSGEAFKIFNSLAETQDYIEKELNENDNLEFVIYDRSGTRIMLINKYERKRIG